MMKQTSSSRITVFRNLKEIGYTTSYNRNGKYYTLLEIAKFDESGIFDHKGILFFRDGGIQELSNKIRTRVSNQLHQFVRKYLIIRKKYADFYVYYSIDDTNHQKQISNREKELKIPSTKEDSEISSEKKTIRILLEIIQNPNTQPSKIENLLLWRHYYSTQSINTMAIAS